MCSFNNKKYIKVYKGYELTKLNSSFPQFFEYTFIESVFLWIYQDLSNFHCNKAEVTCPIAAFPVLEIGSIESAKIIAKILAKNYDFQYFLTSPFTCDINSQNNYIYRCSILPHGSCVDFGAELDKVENTDTKWGWIVCSCILQSLIWAHLKCLKYFKRFKNN